MDPSLTGGIDIGSMGLDLSPGSLIAGFLFSVIGIFVFRRAKKNLNYPQLFVSIGLMIYMVFTHTTLQNWLVGLTLTGLAYYLDKNQEMTG